MTTNFASAPYFDDFDPEKNFYKVLFKPGFAVQARELNQLQSILQHQTSVFANHIFKKNSVVIPGGVSLNNTADLIFISGLVDPSVLIGKTITNATSFDFTDDSTLDGFITAVVVGVQSASESTPAVLYLKYIKAQPDRGRFNINEPLATVGQQLIRFTVADIPGAIAIGKTTTVSKGVFFTKDTFVDCPPQTIIIETDNESVTNCVIGLNVVERIVTSDEDESLLDNANGTPNQYAPGADRRQILLNLVRVDASLPVDEDNFITLMKIENNVVTYVNNVTQYAELMKTLARRTYDANGNFVVTGLAPTINKSADDNFIWANISKGRCYVGGYEYNQIANTPIAIDKPRSTQYQESVPTVSEFSPGLTYVYVAGANNIKQIPQSETIVRFINAAPGTVGTEFIGCGIFKHIQYAFGTPGVDDVYKMFFTCLSFEKGFSIEDIGGVIVVADGEGAPVLHELKISNIFGTFPAGATLLNGCGCDGEGVIYKNVANTLYVIKNTLDPVPAKETLICGTSTANLNTSFVSNFLESLAPLIEVDSDIIKTLYDEGSGENTTSFSVVRRDTFNVTAEGVLSVSLSGDDVFDAYSPVAYYAFVVDAGDETSYDLTGIISIAADRKRYDLTIPGGSPLIGKTLWVYSTVIKQNALQSAKVTQTVTINIATPSSSWMALQHQDVVRIVKVVDSGDPNVAADINSEEGVITNRFILDDGNTSNTIGTGLIKLRRRAVAPTGQIAVRYEYYTTSPGNYVSVDSYGLYSEDLDYISEIKTVNEGDDAIELRRYIDFRTRTSSYFYRNIGQVTSGSNQLVLRDLNISVHHSTLVGKRVLGKGFDTGAVIVSATVNSDGNTTITLDSNATETAVSTFFVGLADATMTIVDATAGGRSYPFPKEGEVISYKYTKFKPKQVMIYIDRQDDVLSVKYDEVQGLPEVYALRRNEFKLPLAYLYFKPYTVSIRDVNVTLLENPVYQMLDIHNLRLRLDRTEYYASLALNRDLDAAIQESISEDLSEETRGFWNENFLDMSQQDFSDADFSCTVYDRSYAAPGTVTRIIGLQVDSSFATSTWVQRGSVITLPFNEVRLLGCDVASTSNNLNPFNVINYSAGKLTLIPSVDNWIDVTSEPSLDVGTALENAKSFTVVPPIVSTEAVLVAPAPPQVEIVTEITNLRTSWGKDSRGGKHAITFDWATNLGRTGRVNTDNHLSQAVKQWGHNGTYARSLINRRYNDPGVKEYLNAGTHFDQRPPNQWR